MEFLDQYDDLGFEKTAEAKIDKTKLDDRDFALIIQGNKKEHRKFATADPEVTKLSAAYFIKNLNKMPEEYVEVAGPNLKEACFKFDIDAPKELERFEIGSNKRKVKMAKKKEEIKEEDWGLIVNGDPKFPLRNKKEVTKAIEQYDNVKDRLTEEQRKELNGKIKRKAKAMGIETETNLEPNPEVVRDMEFRTKRLPEKDKEAYMKLAHKVKEAEVSVEDGIEVMKRLDKDNRMHRRCLSPEDVLVKKAKKEVEKVASVTDNLQYALQDEGSRMKIKEKLEEKFDEGLVEQLLQDPETIFESLPDPHKDLIEAIVRNNM